MIGTQVPSGCRPVPIAGVHYDRGASGTAEPGIQPLAPSTIDSARFVTLRSLANASARTEWAVLLQPDRNSLKVKNDAQVAFRQEVRRPGWIAPTGPFSCPSLFLLSPPARVHRERQP